MEKKFTMLKSLAAAFINKAHENNLPFSIQEGNEYVDAHGDRQVDILIDYDDTMLLNQVLSDVINKTYNLV